MLTQPFNFTKTTPVKAKCRNNPGNTTYISNINNSSNKILVIPSNKNPGSPTQADNAIKCKKPCRIRLKC